MVRSGRGEDTEEDLRFTESVFRSLPDIIYAFDEEGYPIRWNESAEEVSGYTPEEIEGTHFLEFIPDDEEERVLRTFHEVLEEGKEATVESAFLTKDGDRIPYEFAGGVLRDSEGEVRGVTGIGRDISDRQERERALRTRSETMEASMDGVAILDDDEYVYVNRAHVEIYGYDTEDELLGDTWRKLYEGDELRRFEEEVFPELREEGEWRGEAVGVRKDGSEFDQELSLSTLDEGDGEIVCVVRDVTDRKDRERELVEYRRALETVLSKVPVILYTLDEDGVFTRSEGMGLEALGLEPNEVVGESVFEMYADHPRIPDIMERALSGESVRATVEAEGRVFDSWYEPVVDDDGSVEGVVGLAYDTTERRRRERELERKNERLEEFTRIVSHDLRNPLQVASGRLALALEDAEDAGVEEHLREVADAHDRMEGLIDDLLELAKQGELVEDPEPVPLGEAARSAWASVEADDTRLELGDGVGDDEPAVLADDDRLRQALENLLSNAAEHAGDDVTVRVGWLEDDTGFYVEDDGVGIQDGEEVFEPGYSTSPDGNGFGLKIVLDIAEAHGWEVSVGEGDDGGARFEFSGVGIETG